jgi:hypothetical protein
MAESLTPRQRLNMLSLKAGPQVRKAVAEIERTIAETADHSCSSRFHHTLGQVKGRQHLCYPDRCDVLEDPARKPVRRAILWRRLCQQRQNNH